MVIFTKVREKAIANKYTYVNYSLKIPTNTEMYDKKQKILFLDNHLF